jgi:site-specific DNA-methyltransferase (adenine-specific)
VSIKATHTPYFTDGCVSLFLGDCLEVMAGMPDESADIVVTSPPYNMGLKPGGNGAGMYRASATGSKASRFYDGYDGDNDDAMPHAEYCAWQRAVLAECWRIARLGVFYNHRPRVEHGVLRDPLDGDYGLPLRQRIILDRKTGIDVNLRNFCTRSEYLLLFAKPAFLLTSHSASGMGDIWRIGMETKVPWHPAPFPAEIPARCIEATGARSVLDPFSGSGSTLLAARNAGIRGAGIEKREAFCELAVRRYCGERHGPGVVQLTLEAS